MQDWFEKLKERERTMVIVGAVAAMLIVLLGWLWPLNQRASEARERLARKQSDLSFLQTAAPEMIAAGPVAPSGPAGESLVVLADRVARESGIAQAVASSEPTGDAQLRVRLTGAAFDSVLAWLARLAQQHGVQVASASIDPAGPVGLVNATIDLRAPGR